ncbi:MAG: hypothetical protein Q9M33_13655 [Robiginitomaculum sp.]|nr:hypothetical protein [Robiginitomaculum sp.]MDQ7076462.1 hypothetical protein [Robiginitomaculum sp.]
MKVTGQSSLIAAQQLGVQRSNADAKAASAAFFAELRKTAPAASANTTAPTAATSTQSATAVAPTMPMREAPLRAAQSGAPLPPGSLLNIVV